jgi:putative ABC transport system permease protein
MPFARFHRRVRRPTDVEIARELRDHLELESESRMARGAGPAASEEAKRSFGSLAYAHESVREVWHWTWAEQLAQDVRHAIRGLSRNRVYAITSVVTLALGIGATSAVFSLADPIFNRPFPLLHRTDLLYIVQRSRQCPDCDNVSPAAFFALRERARAMADVGASTEWRTSLTRDTGAELVDGFSVSANLFAIVDAPFAHGHGFAADADIPGHDDVVILAFEYWQRAFGGHLSVLDSTITLGGRQRRVVGVLARNLVFPTRADVYSPLVLTSADRSDYDSRYLTLFARLAPGTTLEDARREAEGISSQLTAEAPAIDRGWSLVPRSLASFHTDDVRSMFAILWAAVFLVLLAASVSVANLALARTSARGHELALRAALGGRRGRVARHLLVESLFVALAGGALGLAMAVWGVRAIRDAIPSSLSSFVPGWAAAHVDQRALVFTLGISIATAITFALLPALRATSVPLSSVLSGGGRGSTGSARGMRWRAALVVAEVSVALVLLTGAALLARSVRNMVRGDPGVRIEGVLTMPLTLPAAMPDSALRDFARRLEERLQSTEGVRAAALTTTIPLSNNFWGTSFQVPGRPSPTEAEQLTANSQHVTEDYFRAMGIRVLEGRGIERSDEQGAPRVAVINQYMSEHFWPRTGAVGQVIVVDSLPWRIVGVVSDVHHGGLDEPMRYEIDRPFAQSVSHSGDLVAWIDDDPARIAGAIRSTVAAVEPTAATGSAITMREMEARHVSPFRLIAAMITAFAIVTLVIAIVGLYGVVAYGVAQRTREIGVRVALGARPRDILVNIAGGSLRLTALGLVIGAAGAYGFAQLLKSVLYHVTANDRLTPLAMAASLLAVALVAALIPATKAMRTDPTVALRQ